MINTSDIMKYIPDLSISQAEKLASEINLLASQNNIDREYIIDILSRDVNDITRSIADVSARRQQTKWELREVISQMNVIPEEIKKASAERVSLTYKKNKLFEQTDLLAVIDVQEDFISGSLKIANIQPVINPINSVIHMAESRKIPIIFTKDWHPANHQSFKEHGGAWEPHCIRNTSGAEFPKSLYLPVERQIFEFGTEAGSIGYSPLENKVLLLLLMSPAISTIYVCGIALEYCVQTFSLEALRLGKKVVILEDAVATASDKKDEMEKIWENIIKAGGIREKNLTVVGEPRG